MYPGVNPVPAANSMPQPMRQTRRNCSCDVSLFLLYMVHLQRTEERLVTQNSFGTHSVFFTLTSICAFSNNNPYNCVAGFSEDIETRLYRCFVGHFQSTVLRGFLCQNCLSPLWKGWVSLIPCETCSARMFVSIPLVKPPGQGELNIELQSLSLMKSGKFLHPIVVEGLEVSNVNSVEMRVLMKLFNIPTGKTIGKDLIGFWSSVLRRGIDGFGASYDALAAFLKLTKLNFQYDHTQPIQETNRQLRSFIQYLTPIRVTFIEGNHRIELATKLFYGFPIIPGEQPEPLPNPKSPFCLSIPQIIVTYGVTNRENKIDTNLVDALLRRSSITQAQKQNTFETGWGSMICGIVEKFNTLGPHAAKCNYLEELLDNKFKQKFGKDGHEHVLEPKTAAMFNFVLDQMWLRMPAAANLPRAQDNSDRILTRSELNSLIQPSNARKTKWLTVEPQPISTVSTVNILAFTQFECLNNSVLQFNFYF